MIEYHVSADPKSHIFTIKMLIHEPTSKEQRISMGKWIPGSYLIRDYAKHVVSLIVQDHQIQKINSNTWVILDPKGPLSIEYTVYGFDLSVRGAYIDDEQALINGVALFMQVNGHENALHQIHLKVPLQWMTTLFLKEKIAEDYYLYEAKSHEDLIDHPLLAGKHEAFSFEAKGVLHRLVIFGEGRGNKKKVADDLKKIVECHLQLFDKPIPFNEYIFFLTLRKDAYGGLEHQSSTVMQCQPEGVPMLNDTKISNDYMILLALMSHEYFHSWNAKKIKPQAFLPYDLNRKAYTEQLWIVEGFTSYYDDLALVRSKIITPQQYFDVLAQNLTKLQRTPGRKKQTLLDSSFDAWIKFYQPNENSHNTGVSYYIKGGLTALLLDLALRYSSEHFTLDTLMQTLWKNYGQQDKGVPEGTIEAYLAEIGGESIRRLLHQALHTTEELPIVEWLSHFGLNLTWEADPDSVNELNVLTSKSNGKLILSTVFDNGVAQQAGLCPYDEIIAIDNTRVDVEKFDKQLARYQAGDKVKITLFRQINYKLKR